MSKGAPCRKADETKGRMQRAPPSALRAGDPGERLVMSWQLPSLPFCPATQQTGHFILLTASASMCKILLLGRSLHLVRGMCPPLPSLNQCYC